MPVCAVHKTAMRQNKRGWYCPRKVGDSWCDYQIPVAGDPDAGQGTPVGKKNANPGPAGEDLGVFKMSLGRDSRVSAALAFAAMLYQGCGPSGATDEALECAKKALGLFE